MIWLHSSCFVSLYPTDFRVDGCTYLDVRLTFRRAESTGLLEICSEGGRWSVVCGSAPMPQNNIMVACNQLGFDPNFARSFNLNLTSPLSIGRPVSSTISDLMCRGNESALTGCPKLQPIKTPDKTSFTKRLAEDEDPPTCSLLEIQCGGK